LPNGIPGKEGSRLNANIIFKKQQNTYMIALIKNIFGFGPSVNYKELVQNGAIIIDVRTKGEFQGGHIKNSVNVPLANLQDKISKLKKDKPVITCCASGSRSASAKSILKSNGFVEVHNGGSWISLQNKIRLQ
jgi:phage shock protein E